MTEDVRSAIIAFVDERREQNIGELCNGSTYDSDSYCLGSNPSSPAISLHGQAVKTLPSQGKIRGSIPLGGAKNQLRLVLFLFCRKLHKRRPRMQTKRRVKEHFGCGGGHWPLFCLIDMPMYSQLIYSALCTRKKVVNPPLICYTNNRFGF